MSVLTAEQEAQVIQIRSAVPIGLNLTRASDVRLRKIRFLDEAGMIPLRSQTVLFGTAGLGKTTYAVGIAAAVTRGKMAGIDGPRNVLISSQEDDLEGVLAPRALAAAADLDRIHFIDDLSFPSDVDRLHDAAKSLEAALVIVDPIAAHLDDGVDSHKDASIRKALAPIAKMAAALDLAVLTVAHPNKSIGGTGLNRLSGSGAFGNAARSVIVFGADPADPEGTSGGQRVIGHLKCNVGKKSPSLTASLELVEIQTEDGPVEQTKLRVTGSSALDAEELLGPGRETERDSAAEFLEDLLLKGPIRSAEIKEAAEGNGLAWRTAQRAKADLGIKAIKKPDGWYWALADWEEA